MLIGSLTVGVLVCAEAMVSEVGWWVPRCGTDASVPTADAVMRSVSVMAMVRFVFIFITFHLLFTVENEATAFLKLYNDMPLTHKRCCN